jgi:hypothetical protein
LVACSPGQEQPDPPTTHRPPPTHPCLPPGPACGCTFPGLPPVLASWLGSMTPNVQERPLQPQSRDWHPQHMRTLSFSPKLSVNAIIERQRRRQRQRPRQRLGQTIIANSSCGTRELKTPLLHVGISRSRQVVLAFVAAISARLRLGLLVRPARQRPSNSL